MKLYKTLSAIFLFSYFFSCNSSDLVRHDLASEQLYVTAVTPSEDSVVSSLSQIELQFSKPIIAESVTARTLFIVKKEDFDSYAADEWDNLQDDVADDKVIVLKSSSLVDETNEAVTITLDETPESGVDYVIVALPQIQSQDYFPLNQVFGGSLNTYFASRFSVSGEVSTSDSAETMATEVSADSTEVSDSTTTTETSTASYPTAAAATTETTETTETISSDTAIVETTSSDVETVSSQDSTAESVEVQSFDWARVLITEVVTDPQQDHSESKVGNGIKFDATPGTGTVSSSDEYIEIFNGTSDSVDMSQWSLNMIDGTDVLQDLSTAKEGFYSAAGSLSDVGPGEFLVVGNPTGAINNSVTIELLNATDEIVDSIVIDDANATSTEDESYFLNENGEWTQGNVTPGYFE